MASNIPIDNPGDSSPISNPTDTIPISNPQDPGVQGPQPPVYGGPTAPNGAPAAEWNSGWTFDRWNQGFYDLPQTGTDPFTEGDVRTGLQTGNSYSDFTGQAIAVGHDNPPPRPDLGSIYSDTPVEQATFQQPTWNDLGMPPDAAQDFHKFVADIEAPADQSEFARRASQFMPVAATVGAGLDAATGLAVRLNRLSQLATENTVGGAMESGSFFQRVLASAGQNPGVRSLVTTSTDESLTEAQVAWRQINNDSTIGQIVGSPFVKWPSAAYAAWTMLRREKSGAGQ